MFRNAAGGREKAKIFHVETFYFREFAEFERCGFLPLLLDCLPEFLAFGFLFPEGKALSCRSPEAVLWLRQHAGDGFRGERLFFFVDGARLLPFCRLAPRGCFLGSAGGGLWRASLGLL